jgi:VWFA-related protein
MRGRARIRALICSMARRILLLLALIASSTLLGGCPQHVDALIQEALPPDDYQPVYMTSGVTYADLMKEHGITLGPDGLPSRAALDSAIAARRGADGAMGAEPVTGAPPVIGGSTVDDSSRALASAARNGLAMDIRNVDDRRYPDVVELRAFVYDETGRFVMGLAPPHFAGAGSYRDYWRTLVDSCGGAAVRVDSFDVTEVREDRREPLAIAYLLDHSSSMGELRTRRLRDAIQRTMRLIRRGDRVAILSFSKTTNVEIALTGDSATFRQKFRPDDLSTYGGGTALYDGALTAIRQLEAAPASHRRSLIIFSDGGDNDSDSSLAAVHRAAQAERVSVYTIAYGQAEEEPLRDLATYTGGRMYRIYSTKEFPFVFADIYRRMNNYYRITYRAPECGGIHTATATLSVPELARRDMAASGIYDRSIFTPFTEVGDIAFANIEFDYDKATIRPESMTWINQVASAMQTYPKMVIEVRGHTDDRGAADYNLDLSKRRAQAVADALIALGIDRRRLRVEGFGETRPLVVNDSEANRTRNRRTEFVIVAR